jgi:uncharacterized membrane protein
MPYVLSALTFTVLVALLVPPIQGFDEGAHYVRADEISHGEFLARRLDAEHAGGQIDRGVIAAIDIFYPLATNRTPLLTRALLAPIPWGPVTLWSFPNTAVYPPPYYLPMAAAIRLGKALGFDVVRTLRLSRLVNALVCVTVAGIAVALAESGAIWLVALLLLPSSVALMGSMTQDGLCLATAALAGSLTLRLRRPVPRRGGPHVLLCVVLAVLAMCRPPYAGLALLPLAASGLPVRMRYVGVAASLAAAAAWWAYCAAYVFVSVDPSHQAHAGAQLLLILTPPWRIVLLMANTLLSHFRQEYAGYFITTFQSPSIYNGVAWAVLTLAERDCGRLGHSAFRGRHFRHPVSDLDTGWRDVHQWRSRAVFPATRGHSGDAGAFPRPRSAPPRGLGGVAGDAVPCRQHGGNGACAGAALLSAKQLG